MGNYSNPSYVGAPYNFVPFTPNVVVRYKTKDDLVSHAELSENTVSGEIRYRVTAKTDLFVDGGNDRQNDFYRDEYGRYAIPGSTIRGLIRNNVQILGLCDCRQDVDDDYLMYRRVGSPKTTPDRNYYNTELLGQGTISVDNHSVSVLKNVKAGYIRNEGGNYYIYGTIMDDRPNSLGMNYYVLSERSVVNAYLKDRRNFPYPFFTDKSIKDNEKHLQHLIDKEFERHEKEDYRGNIRIHWEGVKNDNYHPYYASISYQVKNNRISALQKEGADGFEQGTILSTGKMDRKKVQYVIPSIDQTNYLYQIPKADVNAYKVDLNRKQNSLRLFGGKEWFDLPQSGVTRPVFYIERAGRVYFGYTPRLRVFYDHTIREGLPSLNQAGFDYAKALFGFSNQEESYKTRLSFSDAILRGEAQKETSVRVILAEPKPTSYMDYIRQNDRNGYVSYNTPGFQLRGVKQYWLKKDAGPVTTENPKMGSTINALSKGSVFEGTVRFKNLHEDELGLLLWSIGLNPESDQNIGKGKPYGYGRIKVEVTEAKKVDLKKAYAAETLVCDPFTELDVHELIAAYKKHVCMSDALKGREIDSLPAIKAFFDMKDGNKIPDKSKTEYMTLKQYRNRPPLPDINDVITGNVQASISYFGGMDTKKAGGIFSNSRYGGQKQNREYSWNRKVTGTIKKWFPDKEYGYISVPDRPDYRFTIGAVNGFNPSVGQTVRFRSFLNSQTNKYDAKDIELE